MPILQSAFQISWGSFQSLGENTFPLHHQTIRKRKRTHTSDCDNELDTRNDLGSEVALRQLFSEFPDFTSQDNVDKSQELREDITYVQDNPDSEDTSSDITEPIENVMSFPGEREAGKAISVLPFVKERQPMYNFFRPFQNAMDFKLARFFHSAHVPKARIDEFFRDGFLEGQSDAPGSIPVCVGSPGFSFRSSHTLYQKIDEMIIDPPWKNGFVDFRLAKNTEFWYRDILKVLKYLLRRKSFQPHMSWAPVKQFDSQQERVYTEMNTASWWWNTQVCI